MKRLLCLVLLAAMLTGCAGTAPAPEATAPTAPAVTVPATEPEPTTQPTTEPTTEPTEPPAVFAPAPADGLRAEDWGIHWEIFQGESLLTDFSREEEIHFGAPEDYFALPGIATFRGDNYRSGAAYGTVDITQNTIKGVWREDVGALGYWAGCGWTGQPLLVQWDEQTKQIMNLREEKKAKEGLVEVIYATLDGCIYFLDLDDGSWTRDPMYLGMSFKGAGALDPRGYPLMYVGSGDVSPSGQRPRMFIVSLIDTTILYEYGNEDSMALRTDNSRWCAFDSSPLVHGDTDTLIWPGENGVLYTIKLNTAYDKEAGTLSIDPDTPVCTRYTTARTTDDAYWLGYEASIDIVDHYLYCSENGGMFYCVDLNTMELVWAQDTLDDSNSSPIIEYISEEEAYVYTAPSLHWTQNDYGWGDIYVYKLNALTGEIVWQSEPYNVYTVSGASGGVQATGILGREGTDIEGMIIYPIARHDAFNAGILVALDTQTGQEVWRQDLIQYAWSSPLALYTEEGKSYIVIGDSGHTMYLLDGATGELLDTTDVFSLVEASPAAFGNKLVVGTRGYMIHCLSVE